MIVSLNHTQKQRLLSDWTSRNDCHILNAIDSFNVLHTFHEPETIPFNHHSYSGIIPESVTRFIFKNTDTAIYPDQSFEFHSYGTRVYELNNIIVNHMTRDLISIDSRSLLDISHHTRSVLSWISCRNGLNDLGTYINYLLSRTNLYPVTDDKPSFILNTRWSATNYYHWIHEALPRLIYARQSTDIFTFCKLLWLGSDNLSVCSSPDMLGISLIN